MPAAVPAASGQRTLPWVQRLLRVPTSNLEISPAPRSRRWPTPANDSYLVDPASSHMLVSKIKPCMSKYKQLYTVKLRMAH